MDRNQPKNEELRRFRAEAAGLMEIEKKKTDLRRGMRASLASNESRPVSSRR